MTAPAAEGAFWRRPAKPPLKGEVPAARAETELVTKTRTNEKVVRESSGEQLLKGYRGEIAQRLMNTASVVEQQVFRNRI